MHLRKDIGNFQKTIYKIAFAQFATCAPPLSLAAKGCKPIRPCVVAKQNFQGSFSSFVFRTTMGENVLEYDGVLLDEDDPYYEECSSSEDDFLEIPLNDRFFYKH